MQSIDRRRQCLAIEAQPRKFIFPIGPQHPALKEPGHFEFTVDGEIVTAATVRLGYVHRGIEKGSGEPQLDAEPLSARTHLRDLFPRPCHCLSLGGRKTGRGEGAATRAGHPRPGGRTGTCPQPFVWLGVAAHEGGFDTLFMYTWRDRETVMDLLESLTGNRVNYSANVRAA